MDTWEKPDSMLHDGNALPVNPYYRVRRKVGKVEPNG